MTAGWPAREATIRRKVTASGVIWLAGRSYYVSRRLAGRNIMVKIGGGKLVVDVAIPLRKEYILQRRANPLASPDRQHTVGRPGEPDS
jgi:hypothetical protein